MAAFSVAIRPERQTDQPAIARINEAAFGRPDEARLVAAISRAGATLCSLVGLVDGTPVGHILFTPVMVEPDPGHVVAGLGPLAVLPAFQRRGIGGRLVEHGLARCRALGVALVVVVGHPDYYPRFGFVPAAAHGLRWEVDVPDEVFMVRALSPEGLGRVRGLVRYRPEFAGV
ncbi:MAG: N-acetyltransferase [Candidatus Promineifilaceae bacterium]|nr:N-acetyltransferase [Candidatus Promineifilaceae bacterium]